ncbi:MAG: deferrochelatase/peroxidase EfeB [Hyphomicrobiales bacterium]|nr:deferrochelatase/peroxidase EfeB [Hyphomicrobiales bacterium]MBV8662319.1 deferrochelatase/peroxidase EfeB [Hyphomicrobiales bacterium]
MTSADANPKATRRGFLGATAGLAALTGLSAAPGAARALEGAEAAPAASTVTPFWGEHQAGVTTPQQAHTYLAAFDLVTTKRADVETLLRRWTDAAAAMSEGRLVEIPGDGDPETRTDPSDVLGLSPERLSITFGFGLGLFEKKGVDRYGLKARRPAGFTDLPHFPGDQFVPDRTGGDLLIQACAENPQIAFHAARQLARIAYGVAEIRWVQSGFVSDFGPGKTPRNLMGFKDGTGNPPVHDEKQMDALVWVGDEAPDWMRGGTYMVVRRARIALEHWDRMKVSFQEQTFGRQKLSGAPLGGKDEFDPVNLEAKDANGDPLIPENAHVRLARQMSLEGTKILRRSYSYNDGANLTAERWPPWKQGMEFDAGLIFICHQRDFAKGFVKINDKLSRFDMMNQFVTNVGGGHFAVPRGAAKGEYIGQKLFEAAS